MVRRGGAIIDWFQTSNPITGTSTMTTLSKFLVFILLAGIILAIVLPLVLTKKDAPASQPTGSGGSVAPPIDTLPGRITIAEVAQAPSAGQAIVYFSQASSATCESCIASFDINTTYTGGSPSQHPSFKTLTSPSNSGTLTFEYGASQGPFDPITPGGNNTTPPTSVTVQITARSTNPQTGAISSPTSYTKTIPYVA
jgi:hypothetical protein